MPNLLVEHNQMNWWYDMSGACAVASYFRHQPSWRLRSEQEQREGRVHVDAVRVEAQPLPHGVEDREQVAWVRTRVTNFDEWRAHADATLPDGCDLGSWMVTQFRAAQILAQMARNAPYPNLIVPYDADDFFFLVFGLASFEECHEDWGMAGPPWVQLGLGQARIVTTGSAAPDPNPTAWERLGVE